MYTIHYYCLFPLLFYISLSVNGQCPSNGVALRFRGVIIPNNSYILYQDVGLDGPDRVYCITDKKDCCNYEQMSEGDWYLPNRERIRGGYEYPSQTHFFARSRGFRNIGLYRLNNPTDKGRFFCELPDLNGINHTLFVNIVDEIPVITSHPVPRSVLKGQNVIFSIAVSTAMYSVYLWQKNNIDITEEPGHYQGTTTPILTVTNVQEENEGDYRCVVDDFLLSYTAELSVGNIPIVISQDMTEINITSGEDIDFLFNVTRFMSITSFHWRKDAVNISSGNKYKGTSTDTLTILNAQSTDEGTYTLIVNNGQRNIITSLAVYISIVDVTVEIDHSGKPVIGIQFYLLCTIKEIEQLNPKVNYQWYKDGTKLLNGNNRSLIFTLLTDVDVGVYNCALNITSEYLSQQITAKSSEIYKLSFSTVTFGGRAINNNDFIYYDKIGQQGRQSALVCRTNSSIPMNSESVINWFFPNGKVVSSSIAAQLSHQTMFTKRSHDEILLHRAGRPSQIGRYFCIVPYAGGNETIYIYIGSRLSLSLRGVTIYNNNYINIDDIGGNTDKEALLCHTDNINCCTTDQTGSGEVLGEWYYPNGSKVTFINGTEEEDTDHGNVSAINSNFFGSRSESLVRLFHSGTPLEMGKFCCQIPDREGVTLTQCVNIESSTSVDELTVQPVTSYPTILDHTWTNFGYFIWAVSSTTLLILLFTMLGCLLIIAIRRKKMKYLQRKDIIVDENVTYNTSDEVIVKRVCKEEEQLSEEEYVEIESNPIHGRPRIKLQ